MTSALIFASISPIAPCGLLAAIFTGAAAHVLDMLNLLPFLANPLEEKASQLWANPALVKERRRKEAVEACPGAAPGVAGDPVVAGDPGVAGEDPAGAEDARKQRGRPAEGRPLQLVLLPAERRAVEIQSTGIAFKDCGNAGARRILPKS